MSTHHKTNQTDDETLTKTINLYRSLKYNVCIYGEQKYAEALSALKK